MFVEKSWGSEEWLVNNELYCLKKMKVKQGLWTSEGKWHYHKIKDETFIIQTGILRVEWVENKEFKTALLNPGETKRIYPNTKHRFTSETPDCEFLEVSTKHFDEDSYRI
jgi:mannose-6-phosphate isomerase-like protein (cupin superfamily)